MGTVIIKLRPDEDRYVQWVTTVDGPGYVGTREQMLRLLADDVPRGYDPKPGNSPEDRMARCDECGTTALFWDEPPYFGAFADTGMVVDGQWWLPRANLPAYIDAYLAGDERAAEAVMQRPDGWDDEPDLAPADEHVSPS